ncbi:serralysin family metalloprotease, partial [Pseudomonas paraeruginosa]|uniref:serralysin family metalloprotease n=1 Tax=Pseudomonas paraeruginosa TaxID=2994495 RepID=UPI0024DE0D9E
MTYNDLVLNGRSDIYKQVDVFLNAYARGGDELINGKPSFDSAAAAEEITRTNRAWVEDASGSVNVSYYFLEAPTDYFNSRKLGTFTEFSNQQKAQTVLSLQSWSDVANVSFIEADSAQDADITYGFYSKADGGGAFASTRATKSGQIKSSEVWMRDYPANANPDNGNYGRQTLTHESGHALGLSHPGNYNATNGSPSYANASYAEDTRAYSVMSYWGEKNTGQDFKGVYSSAPLMDDIAAIQKLYGANMTTRTDDTVYGFNSNTERDFYTAASPNSKLVFSVWDADGNDTLDFSGFSQNQKINLNEKALSDVGGLKGNVSIAAGVTMENAIGGSGRDLLIGNDVANVIKGGAGNDVLYGGLGADQLWGGSGADT